MKFAKTKQNRIKNKNKSYKIARDDLPTFCAPSSLIITIESLDKLLTSSRVHWHLITISNKQIVTFMSIKRQFNAIEYLFIYLNVKILTLYPW